MEGVLQDRYEVKVKNIEPNMGNVIHPFGRASMKRDRVSSNHY